jgi:hypothetical protein
MGTSYSVPELGIVVTATLCASFPAHVQSASSWIVMATSSCEVSIDRAAMRPLMSPAFRGSTRTSTLPPPSVPVIHSISYLITAALTCMCMLVLPYDML